MLDDQRWRDSYDAWKLASPPDYGDPACDPEPNCADCLDLGYEIDDDGVGVPCKSCSAPVVLEDLMALPTGLEPVLAE